MAIKKPLKKEKKHTILCVDDSEMQRNSVYEQFKEIYNVLLSSSGEECLELIKGQNDLSLILMDIVLDPNFDFDFSEKKLDGVDTSVLVKRWYKENGLISPKIIIQTGYPGISKHEEYTIDKIKARILRETGDDSIIDNYLMKSTDLDLKIEAARSAVREWEKDVLIARLERANIQLKEAQASLVLREKDKSLAELAGMVAHDVGNPLRAIMISADSLKQSREIFMQFLSGCLKEKFKDDSEPLLELLGKVKPTDDYEKNMYEIKMTIDNLVPKGAIRIAQDYAMLGFGSKDVVQLLELFRKYESNESDFRNLCWLYVDLESKTSIISSGAKRVDSIFSKLLTKAKHEICEYEFANINQGIDETVEFFTVPLAKKGIRVIKEYDSVLEMNCYFQDLNRVWQNIIKNAIEAIDHDHGEIKIMTWKEGDYAFIRISNNGPLLEACEDMFGSYTSKEGDVGLGLKISKLIVDNHNGLINSGCDEKTYFEVMLPYKVKKND